MDSFIRDASDWVTSQRLRVLVMGPGSPGRIYDKRVAIRDYVKNAHPDDEVYFPEDAIAADQALSDLDPDQAEEALVRFADAVVIVLSDDPKASGPLAEANQFIEAPTREKVFIIEPTLHTDLMRKSRAPYAFQKIRRLDADQRFSYTDEQLSSCTAIRERVRKWLNGVRFEKRLRDSGS